MRNKIILIMIIISYISNLIITKTSLAVEFLRNENPAPNSVEDLESPIGSSFRILPRKKALFPVSEIL